MILYVENKAEIGVPLTVYGNETSPSYMVPPGWFLRINGITGSTTLVEQKPEEG